MNWHNVQDLRMRIEWLEEAIRDLLRGFEPADAEAELAVRRARALLVYSDKPLPGEPGQCEKVGPE